MSISATLTTDGQESAELHVPRGKTLSWTTDETSLANGRVRLLISANNRGAWRTQALTASDSLGKFVNDTGGSLYVKFKLEETAASLSGSVIVSISVDPQVIAVVRDLSTNKPLVEYTDSSVKPLVPLDFSVVPVYANNAAALAAGAAAGTIFIDPTGAVYRVTGA